MFKGLTKGSQSRKSTVSYDYERSRVYHGDSRSREIDGLDEDIPENFQEIENISPKVPSKKSSYNAPEISKKSNYPVPETSKKSSYNAPETTKKSSHEISKNFQREYEEYPQEELVDSFDEDEPFSQSGLENYSLAEIIERIEKVEAAASKKVDSFLVKENEHKNLTTNKLISLETKIKLLGENLKNFASYELVEKLNNKISEVNQEVQKMSPASLTQLLDNHKASILGHLDVKMENSEIEQKIDSLITKLSALEGDHVKRIKDAHDKLDSLACKIGQMEQDQNKANCVNKIESLAATVGILMEKISSLEAMVSPPE